MASERILVVEDDQAVADLIARYLKRSGYEVAACVGTGEEAFHQAERTRPHLALMDIGLRGALDGVQTAERLRARFDIPVVFLTGLADDATIKRSQDAKAFGYVLKPFRQEDLRTSIDLALSKHQVESKLRRIEGWFTAAIKSIADAVITTDDSAHITFLNPVAEALLGWRLDERLGRPLEQVFLIKPGSSATTESPVRRSPTERVTFTFPRHTTLLARDGSAIPIECSAAPVRNDQSALIGSVLVFRDITERRQAEEELKRSREELRSLAAHLQNVREEERTRMAREIHDELGQMLTGLKMDLSWIERRLPAIADETLRQPLADKSRSMVELLDQMVKTVRKISAELRPGVLDDLGLVPAMEWQARDWEARTGIECEVASEIGECSVPPELGTALFRIFQETLTNVARHAQATEVRARLGSQAGNLTLEIRDNGRGITEEEQRHTRSFGLLGMKERASLLGGKFSILGTEGSGTTVHVSIPHSGR
jgi:two-component system sensor histidine kinase UhpB